MSRKVVYIACVGYSGSTVLDLLLGGHPRIVGVGEVGNISRQPEFHLPRTGEMRCSCGELRDDCVLWGKFFPRLRENPSASCTENYRTLVDIFDEVFGPDIIMVDSSKSLWALESLRRLQDVEVKVLYMLKDVRSWTISSYDMTKREGEHSLRQVVGKYGWKGPYKFLRRVPLACYWYWYRRNREYQDYFRREGVEFFQFGYDELAVRTEEMLRRICRFIGVEYVEGMQELGRSNSHVAAGNRMKWDKDKRTGIYYDNRWARRREWVWPALLLPHISRYNLREVYRNSAPASPEPVDV